MHTDPVAAIYAELPDLACRGLCQDSCGPIGWSTEEAAAVTQAGGEPPTFGPTLRCTYLDDHGRCRVYAVRPLICRLFGLTDTMRCRHGCTPSRWLTEGEARALLVRYEAVVGHPALPVPREDVPQWIKARFVPDALQGPPGSV